MTFGSTAGHQRPSTMSVEFCCSYARSNNEPYLHRVVLRPATMSDEDRWALVEYLKTL